MEKDANVLEPGVQTTNNLWIIHHVSFRVQTVAWLHFTVGAHRYFNGSWPRRHIPPVMASWTR